MRRTLLILFLVFNSFIDFAQNKMRRVEDLINNIEPGWELVSKSIKASKNKVEVLSADTAKAKETLYQLQVTTRSPMGAVVFMTGGILIDNGWIRILGSGNSKLNRTITIWNKGKSFNEFGERPAFLLIADDVVGGFYAVNGGQFGKDAGQVYYLEPESLEWTSLNINYSEFLDFCLNGNIEKFYENLRWTNWKDEVSKLDGNYVFSFYPYLWTKEGKDINKNVRKAIPIQEQYIFNLISRKQLGLDK